jgi:hypothetical protein
MELTMKNIFVALAELDYYLTLNQPEWHDRLAEGLSDGEIQEMIKPYGLAKLPDPLNLWFGWRNGLAPEYVEGKVLGQVRFFGEWVPNSLENTLEEFKALVGQGVIPDHLFPFLSNWCGGHLLVDIRDPAPQVLLSDPMMLLPTDPMLIYSSVAGFVEHLTASFQAGAITLSKTGYWKLDIETWVRIGSSLNPGGAYWDSWGR